MQSFADLVGPNKWFAKDVTICKSVKPKQFKNRNFISVTLSDGVKNVGAYAFAECSELKKVIIKTPLTKIGTGCFEDCKELEHVEFYPGISTIPIKMFGNCTKVNLNFPDSITKIGKHAFLRCNSLEHVRLVNVSEIGIGAFLGCKGLQTVYIRGSITEIKQDTFKFCENLTNVSFGKQITSIKDCAFARCYALVHVPDLVHVRTIGERAFQHCAIPKLNIGANVLAEGSLFVAGPCCLDINAESFCKLKRAFGYNVKCISKLHLLGSARTLGAKMNLTQLKSLTLPNGLVSIRTTAFSYSALTELHIPATVTTISNGAFQGIGSLKVIYAPSAAFLISNKFENCDKVEEVHLLQVTRLPEFRTFIPKSTKHVYDDTNSLREIGNGVFADSDIEELHLSENSILTTIGNSAFYNCVHLKEVPHSRNLTYIGTTAFKGCKSLERVWLDGGIKTINPGTFRESGLQTVHIAAITIHCEAFYDCRYLNDVTLVGVKTLGNRVFRNCNINTLQLPMGLKTIGISCFELCYRLKSIDIPSSVTEVGCNCFRKCTSLTNISLPVKTIRMGVFSGCLGLVTAILSPDIRQISSYAFEGCISLQSLGIGDTFEELVYLGEGSFMGTLNLRAFPHIPKISAIPDRMFEGSGIESIGDANQQIISVGDRAFHDCDYLESFKYQCSNLLHKAFKGCQNLRHISLSHVRYIGDSAFQYCTNLRSVDLYQCVHLGDSTFRGCFQLQHVDNVSFDFDMSNVFKACHMLRYIELKPGSDDIKLGKNCIFNRASKLHLYCWKFNTWKGLPDMYNRDALTAFILSMKKSKATIHVPKEIVYLVLSMLKWDEVYMLESFD